MVSDKKIFSCFPYICKICDAQGRCHFWPQGHNLYKLGKGPLGDIKVLGLVVSDKILLSFHLENLFLACVT